MPEASGGEETDGASTGLLTGDTAAVGGELAGDETGGVADTLLEGLVAGETDDAGDFAGGAVAGGGVDTDPDGEIAGVCEGGDKVGDFAGDTGEFVGETETEDGGFAGEGETDDLGEEAGAFCANKTVKNIESTKSENNLFIFEVFEDLESTRKNETMG